MNTVVVVMILLCTVVAFGIANALSGKRKPLKTGFIYVFLGIISLIAVNASSVYTGINIPISCYSILVSGIGGIPGTVLLSVLQFVVI